MNPDLQVAEPAADSVVPTLPTGLGNEKALALARDSFSTSETFFDSSIRKGVIDDMRQAQSLHKHGSKYLEPGYRTRSRIFRPKTRAMVRKGEASAAAVFFNRPDVVEVTAEDDSSDLNVAASKLIGGLINYRLAKSIPWFLTVVGAYQDGQTTGVVISHQDWEWDEAKGIDRPCITLVPIENLRIDPAASWTDPINSSPYVIHQIPMYVKDVQSKARGEEGSGHGAQPWYPMSEQQLLRGTKNSGDTIRGTRERGRTDSQSQSTAITPYTIVWVHRNIVEWQGIDYVYYTLGDFALLSSPVPLKQKWWHGLRPYVMGCVSLESHKVYPGGPVRMTSDLQAEINEIANQRIDSVKYSMSPRLIVKRNQQVDLRSLMRNIPGSATLVNDTEKDIKAIETRDVTASSYKEADVLAVEFDDVAGVFNQSTVQTNKNLNETVGGMFMMDEKANEVGNYQLTTFAITWMKPVLEQLAALEAHYETDAKILTQCARAIDLKKLGLPAITDELMMQDIIINVDVGNGSPSSRMAMLTNAMRTIRENLTDGVLEQRGLKVTDFMSEVMSIGGYRNVERFFSLDIDPALAAAQQQAKDLQDKLDAKYPPELLAAQVENMNAKTTQTLALGLQQMLASFFEAMQSANLIAVTPAIAPIADKIMIAAGYQQPKPAGVNPDIEEGLGPLPALAAPVPGVQPPTGEGDPSQPAMPDTGNHARIGEQQGIETAAND